MTDRFVGCPLPRETDRVQLAHGGGGTLMHRLIEEVFDASFGTASREAHDAAVVELEGSRLALTTDSYVVSPLFFPGGDIGTLAVNGTVNDLAMSGAKPAFLSAAFILEEGLPVATLRRIVESMARAARAAGVAIVTGDTKVVDRGKGDGVFITTSGIGHVRPDVSIRPDRVRSGDAVVVSGDLGRHGIAVLTAREGLALESEILSDCAPLAADVLELLDAGVDVHCLRDLTRGGLASAVNELAQAARVTVRLDGRRVPVSAGVRAACELLGLDPLYVANEGRFVALVPERDADRTAAILGRRSPGACVVGRVEEGRPEVTVLSELGTARRLDMLSGEQLPRIC